MLGQLVRLKDTRNGREFCIANTHLLFNKGRGDIKLAQLAVLLANIDKVEYCFYLQLVLPTFFLAFEKVTVKEVSDAKKISSKFHVMLFTAPYDGAGISS